jgi:predicted nucleotidyltransferase component of viral defense system
MIDKESLFARGGYEQPYQNEKDYIEEMFLSGIFNSLDSVVFRGGTSISKFYGSVRFSDDLDFSFVQDKAQQNVAGVLEKVIKSLSEWYPIKIMRRTNSAGMLTYELSIRGPLFETLNKYQHLKIEIDKKASVVETIGRFRRNPKYDDLRPYLALVMSEKEILAEKVVALLFRRNLKARDLYDIYYLVNKNVEIKVGLIDRKMKEYGHTFSSERLHKRLMGISKIWEKELRRLLPSKGFVDYEIAKDAVVASFTKAALI